jgi:hypothetical protein
MTGKSQQVVQLHDSYLMMMMMITMTMGGEGRGGGGEVTQN